MNIDKGLSDIIRLEMKGITKGPVGLSFVDPKKSFHFSDTASLGHSIYVALAQGYESGSLFKRLISLYGENAPIFSKHSLKDSEEVKTFINGSTTKLHETHVYPIFNDGCSFEEQLRVASYESWNSPQVDLTYFVQVQKDSEGNPELFMVIDPGNPNGWSKNRNPCYKVMFSQGRKTVYLDEIGLKDDKLVDTLIAECMTIFDNVPLDNVIIEGKVMNGQYQRSGHCTIDLYRGFPNLISPEKRDLTHDEHIDTFVMDSIR